MISSLDGISAGSSLVVGGGSEIAAATIRLLAARQRPTIITSRKPGEPGTLYLDFDRGIQAFDLPTEVSSACIFVAVARLAACADDPEGSARINCEQTLALVDRLTANGVYTLFLSTNQVFDGGIALVPAEAPSSPMSEYGRQKARTEAGLVERMQRGAPIGILRLAKVVSPGMALLMQWKSALTEGREIHAFQDMVMAPTPTDLVADAIQRMMDDRLTGISQLTGPRDVTYVEVGRLLAAELGRPASLVVPTSAAANGVAGATPPNTTLDSSRLADLYGIVAPDAEAVVRQAVFG